MKFNLAYSDSATQQLQLLQLPCDWCGTLTGREVMRSYDANLTSYCVCPSCVQTLGLSTQDTGGFSPMVAS